MKLRLLFSVLAVYLVAASVWILAAGFAGGEVLLNVACDPTRELWADLNTAFIAQHERDTGTKLAIRQSHGGSASQARAVIDGLDADVVSLALWSDTDAVRKAGRIDPGWDERLPNRSLPYYSTIVMVVRRGNPKGISDWPDLIRTGASVITPNPKTSGNGKWSFLALWGSVKQRGGSDEEARRYVTGVYRQVPVLDTAARGATKTFEKNIGDVHLTWENEAYLEVAESKGGMEIVYPPASVRAEPHVAVVDAVVRKKGTRAAAEAYLKYLYTTAAQEIIARHYHRPIDEGVRERTAGQFPELKLFRATPDLAPSWDDIQQRFFSADAMFDQIQAHVHAERGQK